MATLNIPLTKAGKTIEIDVDAIPDDIFQYATFLGLKAILNRGTTSLDRKEFKTEADFQAEAFKIGEKQKADLLAGKTRKTGSGGGGAKSKADPVHTEAIRLAKIFAKQNAKENGIRVSLVSAAEWTRTATAYVDADPDTWLAAARDSIAKSSIKPTKGTDFMPQEDEALKAKKAAAAAERKSKTDATKSGKIPPKAKVAKPKHASA